MPKNSTVILIRHAEKPEDASDFNLAPAGRARAHAYVAYFQNLALDGQPIQIRRMVAAADSAESQRPKLTVMPLALATNLEIHDRHADSDYAALATHVLSHPKYDNADTLICWHHGYIVELAHALGAPEGELPAKWPDDVYGWLLALHFDADGKVARFTFINESLMHGDHGKAPRKR
ncbi:MAG: flagellar basal body-associated protein FliL [Anaerolineales bacterium]|nr:flagellar basal body-associated protein FliL [Anaerolineales bacterium]